MARHELRPGLHATSPGLPLVGPLRPRTSHRRPERSPFARPLPCPAAPSVTVPVVGRLSVSWDPSPGPPLPVEVFASANPEGVPTYSPVRIEPRRRRIPRVEWSTVICALVTLLVIGVPLVFLLFGNGTSVSACWSEDGTRAHAVDGPWC